MLENVPLAPYSTLRVGGPARYFINVTTEPALQEALSLAAQRHWPVFVLAGGSNLIINDRGFPGLVIKIEINSWSIEGQIMRSGAATAMSVLVDEAVKAGLAGLEWAGGLPGTFGGAIRGNAGAFGGEIKDTIESVTSLEIATGKKITRTNTECQFVYRGSIFKQVKEAIVSATLRLQPGDQSKLRQVADDHIGYRQEKHPMEYPNAGSVFKNTPVERIPGEYLAQWVSLIKNDPFPVVPTAKIIADAGLKGLRVGQAQLSEKHTNYIVNLGGATASEIVQLIDRTKTEVKQRFNIELEVEPELVGFD